MSLNKELFNKFAKYAHEQGFPLVGAVDYDSVSDQFKAYAEKYKRWINNGYAGQMEYLVRGTEKRVNPMEYFTGFKSVVCVGLPYDGRPISVQGPSYSSYLCGRDYHEVISEKLEIVINKLIAASDLKCKWKICVDTAPVLERTWAVLCGLGWIGKNGMFVNKDYGSHLLLGEILLDEKLENESKLDDGSCANCNRCTEACPTKALIEPGVVDSNKCISYWTLEKREILGITKEQKQSIGTWVAGCDLCQQVCPFNVKCYKKNDTIIQSLTSISGKIVSWEDHLRETPDQYKSRAKGTALSRIKPVQFSRNLAVAFENYIRDYKVKKSDERYEVLCGLVNDRYQYESNEAAKTEWQIVLRSLAES